MYLQILLLPWRKSVSLLVGAALVLCASINPVANAQVFDQVNGPPGPGPFFWVPDDIGWYWTPDSDVNLISIQTQLRNDFGNLNNDFTFTTTLYTDRPGVGGVAIASFEWNGEDLIQGQWVGGFFSQPVPLVGGTEYFIGMSGWAQALGTAGGSSGAGVNWVDPAGPPAENLGAGSSYLSTAGNPGSFDFQLSPGGLGSTDQPVLRFLQANTSGGEIPIAGYDVNDAILSGFGNWSHSFNGTIVPGESFTHFSFPGTFATYSGVGSGTLNDNFISDSPAGTMLFLRPEANNVTGGATMDTNPNDNVPSNPTIILTLARASSIGSIEIYGGNIGDNGVPGLITAVEVSLLDTDFNLHTEVIETEAFGPGTNSVGTPANDRIDLTGTTLEGIDSFAVFLGNFAGDFELASGFGPSITEIQLFESSILIGDINGDGVVSLLDVAPFVALLSSGGFDPAADINGDGMVNLLDVSPFVALLTGG